MAPSNKIREDAVVRYSHAPSQPRSNPSNFMSQSMPMAAMFLKNKPIAWSSLFLSVQAYLNEPTNKPAEVTSDSVSAAASGAQPPLFQIAFAVIALATCYMDVLFPGVPPSQLKRQVAETVSTAVAAATGK